MSMAARVSSLMNDRVRRRHVLLGVALLAIMVAAYTVNTLMLHAYSLVRQETVLDCPYEGSGAHKHDASCYDKHGLLVCPLDERELHEHTAACYAKRRVLVCGLTEDESHTHTADCYQAKTVLACGKEEAREEHRHGPGCFRTITVATSDAPAKAMAGPDGTLRFDGLVNDNDGAALIEVDVTAPQGALPADSTMSLTAVADDDVQELVERAVAPNATITSIQSMDITFRDARGQKVEPREAVEVTVTSDLIAQGGTLTLVHVGDDGVVNEMPQLKAHLLQDGRELSRGELAFSSRDFSTYCIVVTEGDDEGEPAGADDGKQDASLTPGQTDQTGQLDAGDGETYRITVTCPDEANVPEDAQLEVSEVRMATRQYVSYVDRVDETLPEGAEVEFARFFDISLVKDGVKIQPEAPVEVVIELVNEEYAAAGDDDASDVVVAHFADGARTPDDVSAELASDSGQSTVSFAAEEFSIYAIVVTKIEKSVLASDGHNYRISVSYGPDAQIPADTELDVHEIATDSAAYERYVAKSVDALGGDVEATYARFFDITLVHDGEKVQPAAPVDVTIELADELSVDAKTLHFDSGVDVLEAELTTSTTHESAITFGAESFSVYGVVEVEDRRQPAVVYTDDEPDGQTLIISNKRSNTEFFLMGSAKSSTWMNQTADSSAAQPFLFTKQDNGTYTISFEDREGTTRYLTLSRSGLSLGTEPYAFRLTKTKGYWLFQMGNGSDNYVNHNDTEGFGRWKSGYNDQGNRLILTTPAVVDDPYRLDGKTYGLAIRRENVMAVGMLDKVTSDNRLAAKELLFREDPLNKENTLLVAKNTDVGLWTFRHQGGINYYVQSADGRYLTIRGASVTLDTKPSDYALISIESGSGVYTGTVRLTNKDGQAINLYGGSAASGFGGYSDRGTNEWLNLLEPSVYNDDDFVVYTADKVSVSDVENVANGKQVIVYTRVWNDNTKSYDYYAIDQEGKLVRAYESGNVVQWVGLKVNNLLWDFTEYYYEGTTTPNYYYELQNSYSKKYLAPQIGGGQVLSDSPIGINLNGRRYGDYYSSILAWDDPYYDYAGLRVDNGRLVSCPMAQAEDFYFAVMEPETDELTTVETVDHTAFGITMRMQDYNGKKTDSGNRDKSQTDVLGSSALDNNGTKGLLTTNLAEDGYPTAPLTGRSLGDLYGESQEVNHLFLANTYAESGYFEYNSTKNFAHLNDDGTFTVYNQVGTIDTSNPSLDHGQFMPYNDIEPGRYSTVHPVNLTDTIDGTLPDSNPRKGERLYGIPYDPKLAEGTGNNANYQFGMEMQASFMQSPNGLDDWGHDIIFEFAGDDDMWLYVDGELVLDLGGVHKAHEGTINFRTGEVVMNGTKTTLRAVFAQNYAARGMSKNAIARQLSEVFGPKDSDTVFKDYSSHSMKMFYMERGAGASNLHMRFNLATTEQGTVVLGKEVSGTDKQDYASARFAYQIWLLNEKTARYELLTQEENDLYGHTVTYRGTTEPVPYRESDGTYDSVFYLKPGQRADVHLPGEETSYYIVECGVSPTLYDEVRANGAVLTGRNNCFATPKALVSDRKQVIYDNHVDQDALRTLTITKRLTDAAGEHLGPQDDGTEFRFRMYLGENLDYYRLDSYYVKDPDGNYCTYRDGAFVSLGKKNFADLTKDDLEVATFTTSPNGAIDKILADYSVEIRNLLVDTNFKVEESDGDVPAGYALVGYERVGGTYISGENANEGIIRENSDPAIAVHNKRGWGLTVKKVWSDAHFMREHDPLYVAVYLGDELLEGTVREMAHPSTSVYYFFDQLEGDSFDAYTVREVMVTNPKVKRGVVVSYDDIEPVEGGAILVAGGTTQDGEHDDALNYTVTYEPGQATGANGNVRTDVVTNSRPGVTLVKTDWEGEALAGAEFTLEDEDGEPVGAGTFVSQTSGLITNAYLKKGSYTLRETKVPSGYLAMTDELVVEVDEDNLVTVSGGTEGLYTVDNSDPDNPVVTIKNRQVSFEAVKLDAQSGEPLAGVRFALYRQVQGADGPMKDYRPMAGFEGIVTDEAGKLPGLTEALPAGTYYLTEVETLEGYTPLEGDILLTVRKNGSVKVGGAASKSWLRTDDSEAGVVRYQLAIPNGFGKLPLTFMKVDAANTAEGLPGATFDLYQVYEEKRTKLFEGLVSDKDGWLADESGATQFELEVGEYELVETKAPDGYILADRPVHVMVGVEGVSYDDGYVLSQNGSGISGDLEQGFALKICNTTGYELPKTGGHGLGPAYALGAMLLAAGMYLLVVRKQEAH